MKLGWLLLMVGLLVSACGSNGPVSDSTNVIATDVVLLGAVQKSGLKAPISSAVMATDLQRLFAGQGGTNVTSVADARQIIGQLPHDEMMAFYARNAFFAPYQVQRLMAANLPARRALAVRLGADVVERLPMRQEALADAQGRLIADRVRRVFVTRRVTQLSATMLDLRNGRVIWSRQYRVSPEAVTASDHRSGESFGASVAAAVANTLVQGIGETDYPPPPILNYSVQRLLQEVVLNAPLN